MNIKTKKKRKPPNPLVLIGGGVGVSLVLFSMPARADNPNHGLRNVAETLIIAGISLLQREEDEEVINDKQPKNIDKHNIDRETY